MSEVRGAVARRRRALLFAALLSGCHAQGAPPARLSLSLVAGQPGGAGEADGPGPAARFRFPAGLAWDGQTRLYVADTANDTLRRLDLGTGRVETIAGRAGEPGREDGVGADARLHSPSGLAWDGRGSLYVADRGNAAIRRFEVASGRLSTLLRGEPLAQPEGLAFTRGRLYVSDARATALWAVDPADGKPEVVAGVPGQPGEVDGLPPVARLRVPMGLSADGAGYLYVADGGGRAVRRIDLATHRVVTVEGPPRLGLPIAVAVVGEDLFVADPLRGRVSRWDAVKPALEGIDAVTGSGAVASPTLRGPAALAAGLAGRLFIADATTVRQLDPSSGALRTLAGLAARPGGEDGPAAQASFRAPRGLAAAPGGPLYVADSGSGTVRRIDLATREVTTLSGSAGKLGAEDGPRDVARLDRPVALALAQGALYVADPWAHALRRIDLETGALSTLAGGGPEGLADGLGRAARFCGPIALTADGAGHLYVVDRPQGDEATEEGGDEPGEQDGDADAERPGCAALRRVDLADGRVTTLAGSATQEGEVDGQGAAARLLGPSAVALVGDALYAADAAGETLRRLDLKTLELRTVLGRPGRCEDVDGHGSSARLCDPEALAMDGRGGLWIAEAARGALRRLDLATGELESQGRAGAGGVLLGDDGRLNRPMGLLVLGDRLFISDVAENVVLAAALGVGERSK
ncbi:MAG: hypothetical protein ACYCWW_17940 [Deltaproteobacteria bacterium]